MILGNLSSWYTTAFNPSVELIDHFVSRVEKHIDDDIQDYRSKTHLYVALDDGDDEQFAQQVETYANLDSMGWDMKALFEAHFPNLQRRSAFITVYSSFEVELAQLCTLFQKEKGLSVSVSDLSGSGIAQAANYLQKVGQLDAHLTSAPWGTIKHLRTVRNMIVHRDGTLRDTQDDLQKKEAKAIDTLKYASMSEREVVLEPEFLPETVSSFKKYFKLIDDSIQNLKSD